MKKREWSFDLIRAVSTLAIVIYHYSYNYLEYGIGGVHPFFAKFANGDWGGVFVAVFFMLSGASLWLSHREYENPVFFYYKRWLSIFPIFYLAYIPAYIAKYNELHMLYFGGPRKNFIYTILGIDGYLLNPGVNINYYLLGEWFLGAIIILYVLYPLVRFLFSKKYLNIAFSVILLIAFVCNSYMDLFQIYDGKNIITCLFAFVSGMWLCEYRSVFLKRWIFATSVIAALLLLIFENPLLAIINNEIMAVCVFVILSNLSKYLINVTCLKRVVDFLSSNSFGIFLLHHLIIYAFMKRFSGTEVNSVLWIGLLIANLFMIILAGFLLSLTSSFVVKCIDNMVKSLVENIKKRFA